MDFKDKVVVITALDPKVASYREELIRSQQGELNAVLMYQRLAKVVKTDKERETFLQLAKEEGRHASVFHAYTKEALKPKKTMAIIMPFLYRLLGKIWFRLYLNKTCWSDQ
jgi:rubrerythrin